MLHSIDGPVAEAANKSRFRNAHYPPHRHNGLTTHLILNGELTITYPDDQEPRKETFGPGARLDVDAKRLHEVWMGEGGCTYVIGE
jgi:hypothetical protein